MESYLTLMFGVIGYAEIAFSILPGALIDLFARYTDRQWGILSCQTIAAVLCGVLSVLMGLRSQLAAVIAITCYYMFRTFTFGSLSVFAAVCFPVRAQSWCGRARFKINQVLKRKSRLLKHRLHTWTVAAVKTGMRERVLFYKILITLLSLPAISIYFW